MSRRCITLLTDFGTTDPYVAAMKGVALSVNPEVRLVDITHEVTPHDVTQAAYVLASTFRCFPQGTVHVAVVDPGVGSERRILGAELEGHVFLAPDNGLLSLVWGETGPSRLVSVTNTAYFRHPVSMTFHGRDVFAPVAAHLTLGVDLGEMGKPVDDPVRLEMARMRTGENLIEGKIVHVDRFGNLVTNIPRSEVRRLAAGEPGALRVEVGDAEIRGLSRTYAEAAVGELLALFGSTDMLEISANCGSAADLLGIGRRTVVRVVRKG